MNEQSWKIRIWKIRIRFRKLLCKVFGHDWNYYALLDNKTGEFYPACNRCGKKRRMYE